MEKTGRVVRTLGLWSLLLLILGTAGCAALGLAAHALPPPTIPAKYTDLRGKSVAVMVWVAPGCRIDWPQLPLDVANGIQQQLQKSAKDKVREVEGATFPLSAAMVVSMQEDHPEWSAQSVEEIAPRFGVSRLIYVEVENFQTRSDASVELFRGSMSGRLKVLEVNNGTARLAFSEDSVRIVYPTHGPEEGEPNKNDYDIYRKTVNQFTTTITNLFVPHPDEEE
jgi:hypothetical protein